MGLARSYREKQPTSTITLLLALCFGLREQNFFEKKCSGLPEQTLPKKNVLGGMLSSSFEELRKGSHRFYRGVAQYARCDSGKE